MKQQGFSYFFSMAMHGMIIAAILSMGTIVPESRKVMRIDFSLLPPPPPAIAPPPEPVVIPQKRIPPPPVKKTVHKKPKPVVRPKPKPIIPKKVVTPEPKIIAKVPEPLPPPPIEEVVPEEITPAEVSAPHITEEVVIPVQEVVEDEVPITSQATPAPAYSAPPSATPPRKNPPPANPIVTPHVSPAEQYRREHFLYIVEHIRRKLNYPIVARKRGWQGTVVVSFVVCADGGVRDIKVVKSSGISLLDKSALKTVKKARPFPKPPAQAEIIVPIAFTLS